MFYSTQKVAHLFSLPGMTGRTSEELINMAQTGQLPPLVRGRGGLGWREKDIVTVGQQLSPLRRPHKPMVLTLFVTKGGVLKTTLSLNLARQFALHGIKTLVIGLDLQGDVTTALGHQAIRQEDDLQQAMAALDRTRGLYDYFGEHSGLDDLIQKTDLPTLDLIPETPELIALDQELLLRPRREYWLKEKVTRPLLQRYDLIILDCSPNWNQLITNALVATDFLLSPVECRINNYRNLKMFQGLVHQCRQDLSLTLQHGFVPTRLNPNRKLSREIGEWYRAKLPGCMESAIRESVQGEEATAMNQSIPEFAADSTSAEEVKQLLVEVWQLMASGRREVKHSHNVDKETPWHLV
ncbi:MAG: ParA family protein [Bdellovibrionales bacterium]